MIKINIGLSNTNFENRINTYGVLKMLKTEIIFELIDTHDTLIQSQKDNLLITENDVNA